VDDLRRKEAGSQSGQSSNGFPVGVRGNLQGKTRERIYDLRFTIYDLGGSDELTAVLTELGGTLYEMRLSGASIANRKS